VIVYGLVAYAGLRSVAGIDSHSAGKRIDLLTQRTHQRLTIAQRQIGAAHGTEEEQVAGDEYAELFEIIAETARGMAGSMDDLAVQRTPCHLAGHERFGLERLQVHAEAHALAQEKAAFQPVFKADERNEPGGLGYVGTAEAMVAVQVGERNGAQGELLLGKDIEYGRGIVGRVEHDGVRAVVDDMAVRFKSAERQGDDRHGSLLGEQCFS
jgi:hypothetical protein